MVLSSQVNPGTTISLNGALYRVESSVKVTAAKGPPIVKTMLRDVISGEVVEKKFKPDQVLKDVALSERHLEFLYPEGKGYLFLDTGSLEQVFVPSQIVKQRVNYLKEGVEVAACLYGDTVFSIELPQFLELMVAKVEGGRGLKSSGSSIATLETGAQIEVPSFIEVGDIVKVDTRTDEYIQRV